MNKYNPGRNQGKKQRQVEDSEWIVGIAGAGLMVVIVSMVIYNLIKHGI